MVSPPPSSRIDILKSDPLAMCKIYPSGDNQQLSGNAPQGGASDPLSGAMHKISVSLFSYGTCLVTRQDLGVSK
jgi:hypothetical protein